jgi:sugar/nucleoside kinase (ribokinase family)
VKLLIAGELNPDLILRNCPIFPQFGKEVLVEDLDLTLGSSSAICAAGLARLGDSVTFAATVGADAYGDFCSDALRRAGVDVSLVLRRADLKTGITVSITSARDRALVTYPGAIAALRADDLPDVVFPGHDHFHVSSWYLQDGLRAGLKGRFAAAHRAGLTTSLDTGYDPSEQWSREMLLETLTQVDVFLPNEVEIQGITGYTDVEAGIRSLDDGRLLVVGKLGAAGCLARHRGVSVRMPACPVEVVDTTGAGDSFNAGFLHTWLRGDPLADCLRFAAACGALSTRGLGGTATQASEQDVRNYFESHTSESFSCNNASTSNRS